MDIPDLSRRGMLQLPLGLAPMLLATDSIAAVDRTPRNDWPAWAPARATLYAELKAAQARGKDIRSFGATLDGRADDSAALERAVAAGVPVVLIPALAGATLRITRQIRLSRPITLLGIGGQPTIRVETPEPDLFLAHPDSDDPTVFLQQLRLDNIRFVRPAPLKPHGTVLRGFNLRHVSITRCASERMGLLGVRHTLQRLKRYDRTRGTIELDPAVLAGFSASSTDDLNEDILLYDNHVDGQSYMSQLARFEFARRVAIAGNVARFANVSWWGGGARRKEGGDVRHLRRVRDVYIADNEFSGANGGVYGNNGDGIVVARNKIGMMTDVGVDFEGCFNAQAYGNVVHNVGNFCFATFYAARNIVFRNNVGMQDGAATDLHLKFGAGRYGTMSGRTLFALRSAGFSTSEDAILVELIDNDLSWKGKSGLGGCLPSYFARLDIRGNRFENVTCDLDYRRTGAAVIDRNTFLFDRSAAKSVRLCAASAGRIEITNNVIRCTAPQPAGSIAILAQLSRSSESVTVADNRILAATAPLPLVVRGDHAASAPAIVRRNETSAIFIQPGLAVTLSANLTASGATVAARALPPAFATPPPKPRGKPHMADTAKADPD